MSKGTLLNLNNPYYDEKVRVVENYEEVKKQLENLRDGNTNFLFLNNQDGNIVTISPKNIAKIEFSALQEDVE